MDASPWLETASTVQTKINNYVKKVNGGKELSENFRFDILADLDDPKFVELNESNKVE